MPKLKSFLSIYRWPIVFATLILGSTLVWAITAGGSSRAGYLTAPAIRGSIESTVVSAGVLQPAEFVDVGAQTSGQLKVLHVKVGAKVSKGQLLAEIDPVVNAAKVAEAEATLDNLVAQRRARQEQFTLAALQKKRGDVLLAQDALARAEAEVMTANYRVAAAGVTALDAQIKQARAALDTARANLDYTRITAPMDGEVISISAREGQALNASQQAPTILRLAKLDAMTVWAQVAEADVGRLRIGQDAYFTVLGDSERRRQGKVRQILPAPEVINNVIFYNALIDTPNPDQDLKVQMTTQVSFVLDSADNALVVPAAALMGDSARSVNKQRVRVLGNDGAVQTRTVEVGVRNALSAQVVAGLTEGELVVLGEGDTKDKKSDRKKNTLAAKPKQS